MIDSNRFQNRLLLFLTRLLKKKRCNYRRGSGVLDKVDKKLKLQSRFWFVFIRFLTMKIESIEINK